MLAKAILPKTKPKPQSNAAVPTAAYEHALLSCRSGKLGDAAEAEADAEARRELLVGAGVFHAAKADVDQVRDQGDCWTGVYHLGDSFRNYQKVYTGYGNL